MVDKPYGGEAITVRQTLLCTARYPPEGNPNSTSKRPNRSIKEVLGLPLTPRFRELLIQS